MGTGYPSEGVGFGAGSPLQSVVRNIEGKNFLDSLNLVNRLAVHSTPIIMGPPTSNRIAKVADFLKPCSYNNCAGPRFAQYIRNVNSTVFRDMAGDEVLELHYRLLGYEHEPSLEKLPTSGMSAGYVARETRRALAEVNGAIPIYPGIDIDIPTALNEKRTEPGDVKAAVVAAFRAGAPGVVPSRKYAEMKLTNLAGAGEALQELSCGQRHA